MKKLITLKQPKIRIKPKSDLDLSDKELAKKIFDYLYDEDKMSEKYRNWVKYCYKYSKWDGRIRVYWDKDKAE